MDTLPSSAAAAAVRARLLRTLRRDLIGPDVGANDTDLAREKLTERPSRWYLTGFIAPEEGETASHGDVAAEQALLDDAMEAEGEPPPDPVLGGTAEDNSEPDPGASSRRMQPTSLGLTVLLQPDVQEIEAVVTWGDYRTEPPLSPQVLTEETAQRPPEVQWHRLPREVAVRLAVPPDGHAAASMIVPDSAAPQLPGGGLLLHTHARSYDVRQPDDSVDTVRALTVVLVNRRRRPGRRYLDVSCAFQVRLELRCSDGFVPRCDLSGHWSDDADRRVADLHYRDLAEYAVGRSSSADWGRNADGHVGRVWTEPLPIAEVERVAPNEAIGSVTWSMEALATLAHSGADALRDAMADLPRQYADWIAGQAAAIPGIPGPRRQETARILVEAMTRARGRIEAGIELLVAQKQARLAFAAMSESLARAARQRGAQTNGRSPAQQPEPRWRPFQLAFILLNLTGLVDRPHHDREVVDLLFFPTGGGKTEAYLGLAAFDHRAPAARLLRHAGRRRRGRDALHAAPADARPARPRRRRRLRAGADAWRAGLAAGRPPMLGTWPIEIGLWVGSAASPNSLGGKGKTEDRHRGHAHEALPEGRKASAGAAEGVPVVRHAVLARRASASPRTPARHRTWSCAASATAAPSRGIALAGRGGGRRDLPAPAGLHDRHGGQVRRPALGGAGRRLLRARGPRGRNGGSTALPSRGRARGCTRLAARSPRPGDPGRVAPHQRPAGHGRGALRDRARPALVPRTGRQGDPAQDRGQHRHGRGARTADPGLVRPRADRGLSRRPDQTGTIASSPKPCRG